MSDETDTESDSENATRIRQLGTLDRLARNFGQSLSTALTRGAASGRSLDAVLATIGNRLTRVALKAAEKPVRAGLTSLFRSLFETDTDTGTEDDTPAFARGGLFRGGRVTPFAAGGVVAAPTYFPMAGGAGLMGEAGPEAIMPLARGPDGRLGVAAGPAARPVSVTVTIATPDPAAFRRSEAQVAATLARAVARGQRAL